MTGRKRVWFFGDDDPGGGWQDIPRDDSDPTFEAVEARMAETPDPPVSLWSALSRLTSKQRFVIDLRFGLNGKGIHTLDEIASLMGVSHQAVDQIQDRALAALQGVERSAPLG